MQSYGPDPYAVTPGRDDDEPRVVPAESAAADDQVGPAQQHQHPGVGAAVRAEPRREEQGAVSRELLAEEQARGRARARPGRPTRWVIPAAQRRKADAADAVNELRRAGARSVIAPTRAFKAGNVDVKAGDYIIRGDQPYRTLADMYFSVQNYAPQNPSPYDDTGWTFQYMRNVDDQAGRPTRRILDQPMTLLTADAKAPGGIEGTGARDRRRAHDRQQPVTFRFKNADVKMQAAEEDFELDGHKFRAGAFIIAERRSRDSSSRRSRSSASRRGRSRRRRR